jgi:membrane-associated protease RseP (regulator of RpoE activity)
MSVLWWALVFIAAFWLAVFAINRRYNFKKRNIEVGPGILMWRTKRGLGLIGNVANKSKRGWRAYGTLAAVVGICIMIFVFVSFLLNLVIILMRPSEAMAGTQFVLPGLVPGLTIVSWLIAIFSVMIVHEFSHGIVLRAQGLQVKSVGAMLFVAIPGAFVEPNEKKLKSAPILKRLRIYGAGSLANILFSILCLFLILVLLSPKPGVYVYGVRENGPSENFLHPGIRLIALDNTVLNNYDDYYTFLNNVKPGDNVNISIENGDNFTATADNRKGKGSLGIIPISAISRTDFLNPLVTLAVSVNEFTGYPQFHQYAYDSYVPWGVIDILKWMFLLNLGIGLFNLLPAIPLDGGYIFAGLVETRTSAKKARKIAIILSIVVLAILILNFIPILWR